MGIIIKILFLALFLIAHLGYAAGHKSGGSSPYLQFPHKNFYSAGQMGGISASGASQVMSSWGMYNGHIDSCSAGGSPISDSAGIYIQCPTVASAGADRYIDGPDLAHESGSLIINIVKFSTGSIITSIRFFTGLTNQTGTIMVSSDNPAGEYIGLQYSTDRGDTNWQFVRKNGTTQVLTDTGVAPLASRNYLFRTSTNGNTYKIELMDQTTSSVVASSTYTSGGPVTTTNLRFSIAIETRIAGVRFINFYYAYGVAGIETFF